MKPESFLTPATAIWKLGSSSEDRALDAFAIAPAAAESKSALTDMPAIAAWPWILILAGVHGDEPEGVWLVEELRTRWSTHYPFAKAGVILWARANPDGVHRVQRWNARDVDLNRNLPTEDWTAKGLNPRYPPGPAAASEPETRALLRLLADAAPRAILALHSYSEYQINLNANDLADRGNLTRAWGESLAKVCGYPVTENVGYSTPGSLGTYAGSERGIPTITLEIERDLPKETVLEKFLPVAAAAIAFWETRVK